MTDATALDPSARDPRRPVRGASSGAPFSANKGAVAGLAVVIALLLVALFAP